MKLVNDNVSKIEKIGEIQEEEFTIRASATSFAILSSGLYSNKIKAIIRELSCNARDSHKQAGKENVPFDVFLPNSMDPTFYVQDYGVGLSHDQVMTLYKTYFESTKQDSDDYVGQLGLGSKSPFSYVRQFTVESVFDGILYSYSMYINEKGIPAVSFLGSTETEACNGVKVSMSVKNSDFYQFKNNATEVFSWFDPHPNVIGSYTRQPIKYLMKNKTWGIREKQDYYSKKNANVIQGSVQYPIDVDQMRSFEDDDFVLSKEANSILEAPIDFIVPIGLVQVAPSREHLSYDKRTMQNLINFINDVAEDIVESLQTKIDECKTIWEARLACAAFMKNDSVFRNLYEKLIDRKFQLTYNGSPISCIVSVANVDYGMMEISAHRIVKSYGSYSRRFNTTTFNQDVIDRNFRCAGTNQWDPCGIFVDSNTHVLFVDKHVTKALIKEWMSSNYNKGDRVIEIRSSDKKIDITDNAIKFIEYLGIHIDDVIKTSDLLGKDIPLPVKKTYTAASVDRSLRRVWKRGIHAYAYNHYGYETNCWNKDSIDFSKGGYFVRTMRNKWVNSKFVDSYMGLDFIINALTIAHVIPATAQVIGITKQDNSKFTKSPLWIDVEELFREYVLKNKDSIVESIISHNMFKNANLGKFDNIEFLDSLKNTAPTSRMYKILEQFHVWKNTTFLYRSKDFIQQFLPKDVFDSINFNKKSDIHMIESKLYEYYPLMKLIDIWYNPGKNINLIVEYILDTDKKHQDKLNEIVIQEDVPVTVFN